MEKRVKFDFEIDFIDGVGIRGKDFRPDRYGNSIEDIACRDGIKK